MARKRVIHQHILVLLDKYGPLSFVEIKGKHKEDFGDIADENLAKNLTFLANDGYIERKPGEKGRVIYSLAKSYFHSKLREAIQGIIRKSSRVYEIGYESPAIGFDDEKDQADLPSVRRFQPYFVDEIAELTFQRLELEIRDRLFRSNESNFHLASEIFSRIVWTGFLLEELECKKDNNFIKTRDEDEKGLMRPLSSELTNARKVMEQEINEYSGTCACWKRRRTEWEYAMYLRDVLTHSKLDDKYLEEITDRQWLMLGYLCANYATAYEKLGDVQGTIEENLTWISMKKSLIERIIEVTKTAKFTLVIQYGYEEVELARTAKLIDEIRGWLKALEMGYLDHRRAIFYPGTQNVEAFRRYIANPRVSIGRVRKVPSLVIDPNYTGSVSGPLTTSYLYDNFPEARNSQFWTDLYDRINTRRLKMSSGE
jgi:DNA-binding HxlR family transcriptional regulator